jgi:hypothetical protein
MLRIYVLLALGAFMVVCASVVIGSVFAEKNRRKMIISTLNAENRDSDATDVAVAREMISLYLNMVAKHGPDSEEAKAFRFGTDSGLMKKLHQDDKAIEVFNRQAEIIDAAYRKIKAAKK